MAQSLRNRTLSRFTEVDAPPNDTPLSDEYLSEPLVSLEDCLKNLLSRIQHLDKYIEKAKSDCYYPNEHKLTRDESAAIYLYTIEWASDQESLYTIFNDNLRNEDPSKRQIWLTYLRLLMVALNKLPSIKIGVWRGLRNDVSKDYKEGKRFTWRSATSCSREVKLVIDYFTNSNGTSTIFRINAINGKDISAFSAIKQEKEVLLAPGTRFRVTRGPVLEEVAGSQPTPVIHLEEI